MRTAVSIPDALAKSVDRLAKRWGISRSELYARALEEFAHRHDLNERAWWLDASDAEISGRLDELLAAIGPQATALDARLESAQLDCIEKEDW